MSSALYRLAGFMLVLCAFGCTEAQDAGQAISHVAAEVPHLEDVPRVPGVATHWRGMNTGITFSGVHDSSTGWYTVATPAVSYSFTPRYSADASISIYPTRQVETQNPGPQQGNQFVLRVGDLGDTFVGLHATFDPRIMRNTATASFTIPTGERSAGLGAGKVTYDFSDRMEHYYKQTGFLLDMGAGNSSGLFNRLVTNNYTSVGALVHFQAGMVFWFLGNNYIQSVAYEQRPIGQQTLYSNPGPPGAPSVTVFSGSNLGRDNGVTTSMGIPLSTHITCSGYYSRSFQQNLDTVSMGLTYVFRRTPGTGRLSLIDKALREAETGNQQVPAQQPNKQ